MRVNQCSSCGGFCKKSGCERRDNIVPGIEKILQPTHSEFEVQEIMDAACTKEYDEILATVRRILGVPAP